MRRQGKKLAQVARIQARGLLHIPGKPHEAGEDADDFDEALVALGLQREVADDAQGDEDDEAAMQPCYLWPCNLRTFNLWQQLQSQWNQGFSGASGLDYASVGYYLREVAGLKRADAAKVFEELRTMEVSALNTWAQMRQERAG